MPIAALTTTTIGPLPPPTLEFPGIFDPSMFSGIDPSYPGINTSFPTTTFAQTTASSGLPAFAFQSPFGGVDEVDVGFGFEVPRILPLRERYLDSFYQNFYAAHPFVPPKGPLLVLVQDNSMEPLLAAMRWIGSLYIDQDISHSIFKDAFRLIDGNPLKDGFLVQARLLLVIGLDGNRQRKKVRKLMSEARDISVQIGMNTHLFATANGRGMPILEESWRRTWWELYVVDALMSGVHQTNSFALYDVPTDVALPCEEYQYRTGVSRFMKRALTVCSQNLTSKYLPLCTHKTWKTLACSMARRSRRTPIASNVPASWARSRECQHRLTTSTPSWPTGGFDCQPQSMTLTLMVSWTR